MSIWQYTFTVIPKKSFQGSELNPRFDDNGLFEDDIYWLESTYEAGFFDDVSLLLPKKASWSKSIILFGDEESNCFEVLTEDQSIVSVQFRIDFRIDYEEILRQLIEFLSLRGMVIVDEHHRLLSPNYVQIKNIINGSSQFDTYHRLSKP